MISTIREVDSIDVLSAIADAGDEIRGSHDPEERAYLARFELSARFGEDRYDWRPLLAEELS